MGILLRGTAYQHGLKEARRDRCTLNWEGILNASYGGGVNSGALLVGFAEKHIQPVAIEFADTGGEKPETYENLDRMDLWCQKYLGMPITRIGHPKGDTLRDSCFRNGTLPSKAYGFPGCSVKFKHQLMERYEKQHFGPDVIITKAIGYHAGETRRSDKTSEGRYRYIYPLREWGWNQQDCEDALRRCNLPIPIKSACYFCPSSKAPEILWLADKHPELARDAIAMERNAVAYHEEKGSVTKGLARRWSWESLLSQERPDFTLFPDPDPTPCGCYDGGDEEE